MWPNKNTNKITSTDEHPIENFNTKSTIENNVVIGRKSDEKNFNFDRTILHTLSENADFIGMIDAENGEKITFGQMKDRSVRCALWLSKQGIGENNVVGLSSTIHINDYVPYLATLFINAIVNPWDYSTSEENAQHFFEICRPKVMFACKQSIDKLSQIAKEKKIDCKFVTFGMHLEYLSLEEIMAEQTRDEVDNFECKVPLEPRKKVSQIIFSSGTTSTPKAVMLSYHSLLTRQLEECGMRRGMNCLWYSLLAWITGGILTLTAIRLRCTRILHKEFDAEKTATIIEKYKINFVFWAAYLLMLCHQKNIFKRYDFKHVQTILFSGTKMNKSILEECRKSLPYIFLRGSYGLTEAGGFTARQAKNSKHIDSAGFLCSGVRMKVIDQSTGALLGPNQEGELYFKTETTMLGYLNNPEKNKKTLDEEGWLRSGDLGFYDENGEVIIGDRLKAEIRPRYTAISPFKYEETLIQHPDVIDCAVVGVEHPIDLERPFVFVVKAHGAKVTAEELIEFAASKNEDYRLTAGLAFVNELPRTQSGKKILRKLQQMAQMQIQQ